MGAKAIHIQDITIEYEDKTVLKDLSLVVPGGTSCSIIGPSGCGKTTLLNTLAAFIKPVHGMVFYDDLPLVHYPEDTAIIFQDYSLFPWKTVYENVALGLKLKKYTPRKQHDKTIQILERLQISDIQHRYPHQISGGQKQRTAIGRSLALEPSVLLLDEVTAALDAMTKEALQDTLVEIATSKEHTMIQVTHSIEEAILLGQKIIIMQTGRIATEIVNPLFGQKNLRTSSAFYEMCVQVRQLLEEGRHQ
ncbi:ABC transporter ATP-binding protein [Listeria ilorinensis]|uniref:ABC transporter ATP-binding protein n=1 Tax=Listeria ilorinensis TaxID=2867439 RepID=UPI001EF56E16|nr:ATP-binding cassette domain-containing protein [Listeria ilorinensis]